MALVCDTGPLYAAIDRADEDHAACAHLFGTSRETLVVPAPLVVELEWLVSSRLGPNAFDAFLADIIVAGVELVAALLFAERQPFLPSAER